MEWFKVIYWEGIEESSLQNLPRLEAELARNLEYDKLLSDIGIILRYKSV